MKTIFPQAGPRVSQANQLASVFHEKKATVLLTVIKLLYGFAALE
jgi:hypothetical protein